MFIKCFKCECIQKDHNNVIMLTLFDSLQDCSFICNATKKKIFEVILTWKLEGWFESRIKHQFGPHNHWTTSTLFLRLVSKLTINICVARYKYWDCALIHRLTCGKFQCMIIHSYTHWQSITETLFSNYTFPIPSRNISRLLRGRNYKLPSCFVSFSWNQ